MKPKSPLLKKWAKNAEAIPDVVGENDVFIRWSGDRASTDFL
ncbi:hypothetical protein ACEQPO_17850 [Bacillus sp. SL00103]